MGEIAPILKHANKMAAAIDYMRSFEQIEMTEEHMFCPGVYARVLHMPKGAKIISKIHKTEHFVVCLKGTSEVIYPDRRELVRPGTLMVTKPGTQRALRILTDSTWVGFYPIREEEQGDVPLIEGRIIAKDWQDPELLEKLEEQGLLTHEE